MEHSPPEKANSFSDNQEIFHVLWNLYIHYRIHISPQIFLALRQINTMHELPQPIS
jgi:hypothetical protein